MGRSRTLSRAGRNAVAFALFAITLVAVIITPTPALAASFTVTKVADTNDATCDTDCSLREAIIAANTVGGTNMVIVPRGSYQLAVGGSETGAGTKWLPVFGAFGLG